MRRAAIRRVALLAVGWALLTWLLLRAAVWLERLLALPPLFRTAMVALLVIGLALAIPLAWRLPSVGEEGREHVSDEPGGGRV